MERQITFSIWQEFSSNLHQQTATLWILHYLFFPIYPCSLHLSGVSSFGLLQFRSETKCPGLKAFGTWHCLWGSARFFSYPKHLESLWGLFNLLCSGYQEFISWEWTGQSMKLTTNLYIVLRLRMSGVMPPPPINYHGMHRKYFSLYSRQWRD
jgi:hypothetical protein